MGGSVSINHKFSNRIELSWLGQHFKIFQWFDLTPPINAPTQPSTHQTLHPPMGRRVYTDFKSINRIEISWFVQVLLNFYWFCSPTPLGWGKVDRGGGGCVRGSTMHACMHIHMHTCTHTHMHVKHDKHGCLHVGSHLQFLYMYTCVCVHVHACTCMCTCVGIPPCPRHPSHPPAPSPWAAGSPKHQNSISLELIKIFLFCLKILYLWTLLNSYRL